MKGKANKMVIHGAKDYEFGGKRVLKGVPASSREVQPGVYEFSSFARFRTRLRKGKLNTVVQEVRRRMCQSTYDKGIVTPSGWVEPFDLTPLQGVSCPPLPP